MQSIIDVYFVVEILAGMSELCPTSARTAPKPLLLQGVTQPQATKQHMTAIAHGTFSFLLQYAMPGPGH